METKQRPTRAASKAAKEKIKELSNSGKKKKSSSRRTGNDNGGDNALENGATRAYHKRPQRWESITDALEQEMEKLQRMKKAQKASSHLRLGHYNEKGKPSSPGAPSWMRTFILYFWVVPLVQTEFWRMWYQTFTFDLFHRSVSPRFIHARTIPTNVVLTMSFFAQWKFSDAYPFPFIMNGAFLVFLFLCVWYLISGLAMGWLIQDADRCRYREHQLCERKYKGPYISAMTWAIAVMGFSFCAYIMASLWYEFLKVEGNPWYNPMQTWANPIMWIYIVSLIQAGSHKLEDVPPIISGFQDHHWENAFHFYTSGNRFSCILSALAFPTLYTFVAYISWPHLIGSSVLVAMYQNGFLPLQYRAYRHARDFLFHLIDPPNTAVTPAPQWKMDLYLNPEVIDVMVNTALARVLKHDEEDREVREAAEREAHKRNHKNCIECNLCKPDPYSWTHFWTWKPF